MTQFLDDIIPASWRKRVYAILGLLALIAGTVQMVLVSLGVQPPTWANVFLTVVLYLTAGGNALSRGNTPEQSNYKAEHLADASRETSSEVDSMEGSRVPPQNFTQM